MAALLILAGLVVLAIGGELIVRGAVGIAARIGISPMLAGLTIVGFGTSTPELATSLQAAFAGATDIAIGNVVGSNIYNVCGILGITAIIHPIKVAPDIARFDIWIMLGVTALLLVQLRSGWKISRAEGAVLLALYIGYAAFLFLR